MQHHESLTLANCAVKTRHGTKHAAYTASDLGSESGQLLDNGCTNAFGASRHYATLVLHSVSLQCRCSLSICPTGMHIC